MKEAKRNGRKGDGNVIIVLQQTGIVGIQCAIEKRVQKTPKKKFLISSETQNSYLDHEDKDTNYLCSKLLKGGASLSIVPVLRHQH